VRACAGCHLPVRKADEQKVPGSDRVMHKVCPDLVGKMGPDHKGKKHAGFQAQLRVAGYVQEAREQLTHVKGCVEHGQLGHKDARQYAMRLQRLAQSIVAECDAAAARRKELDRGKQS
jgi:hypothetical protein